MPATTARTEEEEEKERETQQTSDLERAPTATVTFIDNAASYCVFCLDDRNREAIAQRQRIRHVASGTPTICDEHELATIRQYAWPLPWEEQRHDLGDCRPDAAASGIENAPDVRD